MPLRESSLLTSRQRLVFLCTGHQLYNCLYVTWTESDHVTADSPERQAWDKVTAPISFDPPSATVPLGRCIIDRPEILAGFMGAIKTKTSNGRSVTPSFLFFHISVCDEWRTKKKTIFILFWSCLVCNIINRLDYIIIIRKSRVCKPSEIKWGGERWWKQHYRYSLLQKYD